MPPAFCVLEFLGKDSSDMLSGENAKALSALLRERIKMNLC